MTHVFSRRAFMNSVAAGAGLMVAAAADDKTPIQGFDETASNTTKEKVWSPISDRKVRVGLVGYGLGGRAFHAPLIASAPELALVGVVTTSEDRIAQLALGDVAAAGNEVCDRARRVFDGRNGDLVVKDLP